MDLFPKTQKRSAFWSFQRETGLYREFVKAPTFAALRRILISGTSDNPGFDVSRDDFRQSLFALNWSNAADQLLPGELELLFERLDDDILDPASARSRDDWQRWLMWSRTTGRRLPVSEPRFANGLLTAKRRGKLDAIPKEDADYLLSCYQNAYGDLLERFGPGGKQIILPVLLEFTAVVQLLGPTELSSSLLARWNQQAQRRPRALVDFDGQEIFDAPIRGVGSPNGVSLTLYEDGHQRTPARIAYAGMTGDRTLNGQIFSTLFSAGLASDCNRSFVTSAGGILHLDPGAGVANRSEASPLLNAAVGVDGNPIEPEAGTSRIGMSPDEAFDLVAESFQRFKNSTGLASVRRWGVADADSLESRVRTGLAVGEAVRRIRSDPRHSEGGCVIHLTPLLHRNSEGLVEPVRIPVPFSVLNPETILKLTRTARQSYMSQLITDGRRREALARNMHKEQDELVRRWEAKSDPEKDAICKAHPKVKITQSYNFELGIITVLDPPEEVERAVYENVRRPGFRDSAAGYAEKFAKLCEKLENLNHSGGLAERLTSKFLIDAVIRQDRLLIPDFQFESEYRLWMEHVSAPVWGSLEDWAIRREYPAELMAADNILFNSELSEDGRTVWIQPHVMIDLHNFEIITDAHEGVMYVFPGGRDTSLKQCMVPDPDQGISDPLSLYKKFEEWVHTRLDVLAARSDAEKKLRKKLLSEKRFSGLFFLRQGEQFLSRGELDRSISAFEVARKSDLAPVYFWAAVAHQCRFLRSSHPNLVGSENVSKPENMQQLITIAVNALAGSIIRASATTAPGGIWTDQLEAPIPTRPGTGGRNRTTMLHQLSENVTGLSLTVDPEASSWWNQLRACDPGFVEGLLKGDLSVQELECASLSVTPEEEERLTEAARALCALDFLVLAEKMKTVARSMPFTGLPADKLRKHLEDVVKAARAMPFGDPPGRDQIEELSGHLSRS